MAFRPRLARITNFGCGCEQVMPVPLIPLCAISCQIPQPFCEVIHKNPTALPNIQNCNNNFSIPPAYPIVSYPPQETPPAGAILSNSTGNTPDGYLLCNGSEVSRETYQILFNAIGTYYGEGNGTTTFNLPDLVNECDLITTYIIKI